MDTLTDRRLKEMEAEMSRFEEEISVSQPGGQLHDGPARIIGARTYNQVKAQLDNREPMKMTLPDEPDGPRPSSLPILPPPPPPPMMRMPPPPYDKPSFMPPQLRYRPMPPPPPSAAPHPQGMPPGPPRYPGPPGPPPPFDKWSGGERPADTPHVIATPPPAKKTQIIYSAPPVHNKVTKVKKKKKKAKKTDAAEEETAASVDPQGGATGGGGGGGNVAPGIELNVPVEGMSTDHSGAPGYAPVPLMTEDQQRLAKMAAGGSEMGKKEKKSKKRKFMRTAANEQWEDQTLGEWQPDDFRIFCGDLGNEVTDETLTRAFSRYPTFLKARVVRDKKSNKTKGYGFASFQDPNDFVRAMREMNGKYVGNRPIKLRKSSWRDRQLEVVKKKEKEKKRLGFR